VKPIKTIRGYSAYARWLADGVQETGMEIDRISGIPSPYSYSPRWTVYDWRNRLVFVRETAHRTYQVFEVPPGMELHSAGEEETPRPVGPKRVPLERD